MDSLGMLNTTYRCKTRTNQCLWDNCCCWKTELPQMSWYLVDCLQHWGALSKTNREQWFL